MKEVQDLLIAKNEQYGDSALQPLGVFSKGTPGDLMMSRMKTGDESIEKDVDIVNWLLLLRMDDVD